MAAPKPAQSLSRTWTIRMFMTVIFLQAFVCFVVVVTSRYIDFATHSAPQGEDFQLKSRPQRRHYGGRYQKLNQPHALRVAGGAQPARPGVKRLSQSLPIVQIFSRFGFNISYIHINPVVPVPHHMIELKQSLAENALPGVNQIYRADNQTFSATAPPPYVILTASNEAFINMTENWLESLRRLQLEYNIILMAEDNTTFRYFFPRSKPTFRTVLSSHFSLPGKLGKNISTYQHLIRRRTVYILTLLQSGHDVLLVDIDAVWFKDPVKPMHSEYDKYDIWIAQGREPRFPCPCFFYMKSTSLVIKMVYDWIERLAYFRGKVETDQVALAYILRHNKRNLKINYLDFHKFPIGKMYFNWTWYNKFADRVIVAHGNHLGRKEGKIATFKEFNVWLL